MPGRNMSCSHWVPLYPLMDMAFPKVLLINFKCYGDSQLSSPACKTFLYAENYD